MKATQTLPARSAPRLGTPSITSVLVLILSVLVVILLWQLRDPLTPAAFSPYQAPVLELNTSGALPLNLSLSDVSDLSEATFTPSAFRLAASADQPFVLEFSGTPGGEQTLYDLSAGTYPLTLTLLDEGKAYHQFTATQGTVDRTSAVTTIFAFMTDADGRQLFLNARFRKI